MVTASTSLPASMSTVKTAFCFMFVRSVCVPVLKTMAGILTVNNFLFGAWSQVLNKYEQVQSFTAFNSIYNETGLFGIHAAAGPDFVANLVDIATKEFLAVATPGQVTGAELQRAKNTTISAVLMNLESRMVVTEDIGRQILTYGHRKDVNEFIHSVQSLTLQDIADIARKIILTPLTMASWGDVIQVPRYDQVAMRF